jgi:hypothetical protein
MPCCSEEKEKCVGRFFKQEKRRFAYMQKETD